MSADFQKSITFSIMSAKVEALENAIRAIGVEYERNMLDDHREYSRYPSIDAALALLPENAKADPRKQPKPRERGFDDVLG